MSSAVDPKSQEKLLQISTAQAGKDTKTLERHLSEKSWQVRQAAAKALAGLGAYDILAKHAGDRDWTSASESLRALLATKDPKYSRLFLAAARHGDGNVKSLAALGLGRLKPPGAREAIARLLKDKAWTVRQSAVQALGALKDAEGVALIRPALKDKEHGVRSAAVVALAKLGEPLQELAAEILPTLTQEFQRNDFHQQVRAAGFRLEVATAPVKATVSKPVHDGQFFVFAVADAAMAMILQTGLRGVGKIKGFPIEERTLFLKYTNQPIEDVEEKPAVLSMTALNELSGPWILVVDEAALPGLQETQVWKRCQLAGPASSQAIIQFVDQAMA